MTWIGHPFGFETGSFRGALARVALDLAATSEADSSFGFLVDGWYKTKEMNDDATLLRRYAKERDEDAFAELVRRHLALVYGAALRQLDGAAHRAEEVTQSVFTDFARKAASLSGRMDLAGWLYTSTHFAAAKLKRTEQRRQQREQEAHTMHELLSRSPADVDWARLRPVLDDAMNELGDRERTVILQRFFQGRRFSELGEELGLSEDAARMRVERALDKLRGLLAKRQITSTTAALAVALANQPAVAVPASLAASMTTSALASASVVAPAVSVLQFMSTSKIAVGVTGVMLVLALGVATHKMSKRSAAEAALAAANQDYNAQIAKRRALEQRAQVAERDAAQLKQDLDKARAAQVAAETLAAKTAWDPVKEGNAFLARHPEVKQAIKEHMTAWLHFTFGPLYKSLGLTPGQIAEFEALRSESAVQVAPYGPNGQMLALQAGTGIPRNEIPTRIRALLGEDGYRQYQEFNNNTTPARSLTVEIASDLCFTETPLTTEQSEVLQQILASSRSDEPGPAASRFDRDTVIAKAGGVLSALQLIVLDGALAKQQLQEKIKRTINTSGK